MCEGDKVLTIRKFPLEAEALARMGQVELTSLNYEEILAYAQQTVLVMSQLRHYCQEIIDALEERGYTINSEDG